jgi:hypothetical protein
LTEAVTSLSGRSMGDAAKRREQIRRQLYDSVIS